MLCGNFVRDIKGNLFYRVLQIYKERDGLVAYVCLDARNLYVLLVKVKVCGVNLKFICVYFCVTMF